MRIIYKKEMPSGYSEFIYMYTTGPESILFNRGIPGNLKNITRASIETDITKSVNLKISKITSNLIKNNWKKIRVDELDEVFLKILYPGDKRQDLNDAFMETMELRDRFMSKFESEINYHLLGFGYASDMGNEGANMLYYTFAVDEFINHAIELLSEEAIVNKFLVAVKENGSNEWEVVFPEDYNKKFSIL
ncbi:MAG: hypothetical protein AAFY76_07190 [Cyanobacteria bacterium J06649_11]